MVLRAPALLLFAPLVACGVSERTTPNERDVPFSCASDADCPAGGCVAQARICTRESGRLSTLLFEVTPQASDPVYGGARFLTLMDVSEAAAPGSRLELNVRPRVPVTGRVLAPPEQAACLAPARTTLPVQLTFTPREQLLGLSLPSYELSTFFDATPGVREWVFQGSLPPGRYDVYMRPDTAALGSECRAIPQIFRDRAVGLEQGADVRLELQQPPPSALRLTITWSDSLEGWRLDMVHPVTGEVISNRVVLRASDVDEGTGTLVTTLNYSRAERDFVEQGEELVRLTPPHDAAGTVLLQRFGLEIVSPGEGAIGDVSSFGTPVEFQAWVWKRGASDVPVPGAVSFSAIELDQVEDGVLASFEASTEVDATGQVKLSLLPGRYRVRVIPPGLELDGLGLLTGYESTATVWANGTPELERQGGHVIDVPPALALEGRVVSELGGSPLRGVEVRATATPSNRTLCAATDAGTCERPRAPVLQRALAQDPFVPRTRSTLTGPGGRFTLDGLDCGRCEPDASARFDVTVRPDISTGLPWLVRSGLDPFADAEALAREDLQVPMPVVRPMRVTYGDRQTVPGPDPDDPADDEQVTRWLSGALVRVFALLDSQGRPVEAAVADAASASPCVAEPLLAGSPCVQSLIQVAEARTDSAGDFLLLLPPDVE